MSIGQTPMFRRRRLGHELRTLREAKGYTLTELAEIINWNYTKLSRLETAKIRPDVGDVMDVLDALKLETDQHDRLVTMARLANQRGWWRAFVGMPIRQAGFAELESGASAIFQYSPVYVPGLLQTEAYARVRFSDREGQLQPDFDERDAIVGRRERQRIIGGRTPIPYDAILDETLLRRPTAPPDVWAEQLDHLSDVANRPNVTLWVLPLAATLDRYTAPLNGFSVYRFADQAEPDQVMVETETADVQLGDEDELERYRVLAERLSHVALPAEEVLRDLRE